MPLSIPVCSLLSGQNLKILDVINSFKLSAFNPAIFQLNRENKSFKLFLVLMGDILEHFGLFKGSEKC